MAAPLVTGILSLGISESSTTPITQLKESMIASADSNGIINAHSFLSTLEDLTSGAVGMCNPFTF